MSDNKKAEILARELIMQSDWENVQTYILVAWKNDSQLKDVDEEQIKAIVDVRDIK